MDSTWKGYQDANGVYQLPKSTNPELPKQPVDRTIGKTGFADLKPSYPEIQAHYDAMSPTWAGVSASNKDMLKDGKFKSGATPLD